ncbi:unnamed protein product, partial [Discosporangium mesarthrocarpum]
MDRKGLEQAKGLVKGSYINQGEQALNSRRKLVTSLLSNRRLPLRGWDDAEIEYLLTELSLMDSNNFVDNVGVGEREGRVYSKLVSRRNYRLSHGVGRSGDVAEVQPKAAGSSLIAKLCQALAMDALRVAGLTNAKACLVLPLATGMSLSLTLSAMRASRPDARVVVWPRMDQKSCPKAIVGAGFQLRVVENLIEGDSVVTDVEGVRSAVHAAGPANVLCVVSTSSCFAPRVPDKVCASVGDRPQTHLAPELFRGRAAKNESADALCWEERERERERSFDPLVCGAFLCELSFVKGVIVDMC